MTIATTVQRVDALGNGAATVFSFAPMNIFTVNDLVVTLRDSLGNETVISQGVGANQYSLQVNAFPGSGTITYPALTSATPLPTGWTIDIKRVLPLVQGIALSNQSGYFANVQEGGFDYAMAVAQQQQEQIGRCLSVAETDGPMGLIPASVSRANMILGFDSLGNPAALPPITSALSFAGNGPYLSVTQFGAVIDGATDNSAAINAAMASVGALGGGTVYIPAGVCAVGSTLNMTYSNVKLVGAGKGGFHDVAPFFTPGGTTLLWTGANGGTMISVRPTGTQRLCGWAVTDIALVAGAFPFTNAAGVGLALTSCAFGKADITTMEFSAGHVNMQVKSGLGAGESCNNEGNEISIIFRALSNSGTVLVLGGTGGLGNTALNRFPYINGQYFNGTVLDFQGCDNNRFNYVSGFRATGGTGNFMVFQGGTAANVEYARANVLDWVSEQSNGGTIIVQGTETSGVTIPSINNQILLWDYENDGPEVFTGTGCSFWYGNDHAPLGKLFENLSLSSTEGYGVSVDMSRFADVWGNTVFSAPGTQTVMTNTAGNVPISGVQNVQVTAQGVTPGAAASVSNFQLNSFDLSVSTAGRYFWRAVVI